jgi:hypothetical protein
MLLNDFGCAVRIKNTKIEFAGALRHASEEILMMLSHSEEEERKYVPKPKDDLHMVVRTVFQALNPAAFDVIAHEVLPSRIMEFWKYYLSSQYWQQVLKAAEDCNYTSLKMSFSYFLPKDSKVNLDV